MSQPVSGRARSSRSVATARLIWAIVLLAAPRAVLSLLAPAERTSRGARVVVLILGGRNVVQAFVELAKPSRLVLIGAAGVDAIHALVFLGLAAAGAHERWRRAALINVLTALGFCAATTSTVVPASTTDRQAGQTT